MVEVAGTRPNLRPRAGRRRREAGGAEGSGLDSMCRMRPSSSCSRTAGPWYSGEVAPSRTARHERDTAGAHAREIAEQPRDSSSSARAATTEARSA